MKYEWGNEIAFSFFWPGRVVYEIDGHSDFTDRSLRK